MSSGGVSGGSLTDAERLPSDILGEDKVIGYKDACRIWQRDLPEAEPKVSYTEDTLTCAAECNRNGEDWRPFYPMGISLLDQFATMGRSPRRQPCFFANGTPEERAPRLPKRKV